MLQIFKSSLKCMGKDGRDTRVRRYLVHEDWIGHQHPQIDVNWRHHAALQLVFSKLYRIYIVKLQDQATNGTVRHL